MAKMAKMLSADEIKTHLRLIESKLTPKFDFEFPYTDKKKLFSCSCGREKLIRMNMVWNGRSKSCSRCDEIHIEQSQKFGKLSIAISQFSLPKSNKKVLWNCDCGKAKLIKINYVTLGHTSSCGNCNEIFVKSNQKFGKLNIVMEQLISPGSHKKILWKCECGIVSEKPAYNVLTGKTKSKAWQNHPAVKMWKGYEKALDCYHNTAIHVWKKRGYKNTMKLIPVSDVTSAEMPPWMGNDKFHLSHMSNLLRKDPIHYREFSGYGIPNDLPYIWPTKEGMM